MTAVQVMDKNAYLIDLSETVLGLDFKDQSDIHKVFTAIWALEAEVNNGGFSQYFWNSAGSTANFAPGALRRIGASACANIVERALHAVSPRPLPEDDDARSALVDNLGDEANARLELLDSEFFAYPDNLTTLLFDFVCAHAEEFGPTPN
jgi:hypothetical protein